MPILVLGVGNLSMTNNGIGGRVVQQLIKRYCIHEGVEVIEGGTMGLNLLPELEGGMWVHLRPASRRGLCSGLMATTSSWIVADHCFKTGGFLTEV